ncbi:hypothetical protein A3J90_03800 [candidate division WOR-1 bacterium RIFOXYC2_FULL_37_10]|uniref:HEPN domain-containing protein n=1 Tax=candidate division WOR-1 bacterium RIFOXYB2_FULL_37_13 TaxID=1802579 RepID=A0A1F4SYH1_UNCSA|nr:MAG: hypothetical protein A2246_06410 [candidate division WOR-1 bacterium RIFOXYA2_FULL_37_7]OGC24833.1 MAG: hypothetical protein A2310_03740 [candidate division WOR-1 bacterium RIFOXYB2_FULL_37_13]OGC33781.1 MAG: hypothetical protein A3J90_03800 [candidate division WOR-1 bacterium RIFOXYC2_FULL_37_10]
MIKNPELVVRHWLEQSKEDLLSAKALLNAHRYTWCAFICQQTLEKCLKAIYVKEKKSIPPYIHKLERLCQILEIDLPNDLLESLIEIDKYYIASRYPSYVEKLNIKKLDQAKKLFSKTEEIYQWLIKKLN